MVRFSAYRARYLILFGFCLVFTLFSFTYFLTDNYRQYSEVRLSPGLEEQDFFTPAIIFVSVVYFCVFVVLVLALFYSWRSYRSLEPNKSSKSQKLEELRAKSPFFSRK